MISKYLKILLFMGGFFLLNFQGQAEVINQDRMIFKVARSVYSQNDLLQKFTDIGNLSCLYPDSLLRKIFLKEFQKSDLQQTFRRLNSTKLSDEQKKYFLNLIPFMKLFIYAKSQSVVVNPSISKYFILSAKKNSCSQATSFNSDNSLKPGLAEMLRLEIFVRSRFLPSEKSGKTNDQDISKAIIAAKNLMKSIDRQIEEEVYW
jgi:hypothetical protein